jgi:hypothetical protein
MAKISSNFSWDDITIGPHPYSQYRIMSQFLKTKYRTFYSATHSKFGSNIVIKQYPQEKLNDIVSAIRYLYIFNGMKHSIHVYDMWDNNIAMERLDGILDKFSIDDKQAFDCFVQLLYAIREFHSHKVALFNISPKTVGWVNENGRRVYKFFDYTKAKSFKLVKHNPIEDVIALGRMFERYENLYVQAIAKECVSGYFTADQIYQLILPQNDK